jgi:CheY-like chemotaxis protein
VTGEPSGDRTEPAAPDDRLAPSAALRRRQAVEINDNIIQGLVSALMAAEAGRHDDAQRMMHRTLDATRRMMADLLAPLDGHDLDPADLIRDRPAPTDGKVGETGAPDRPSAGPSSIDVLLVDDAAELRFFLRHILEETGRFNVVGEAADGIAAIEQALQLQPRVVLLDVAMPKLDGLGALPHIRKSAPDAIIIVLSGFGAEQMQAKAMDAGAAAYIEKGAATRDIVRIIGEHLTAAER